MFTFIDVFFLTRRGKFVADYDKGKNTVENLVAYLKSPPAAAKKTEL